MLATTSASFLKEFTLYADKINNEKESLIVTRSNDKNLVVLSLEEYNEMKRQIFLTKQ